MFFDCACHLCYILCYFDAVKRIETKSKPNTATSRTAHAYQQVEDGRKQRVRGLWRRNDTFYAQLRVDVEGRSVPRRVPLKNADESPCATVTEAKAALARLKDKRDANALPTLRQAPKLADYLQPYLDGIKLRKRPETVRKEKHHLDGWVTKLGQQRLDAIRKPHIQAYCQQRLADGANPRTVNLDVIALRGLLKSAMDAEFIQHLPTHGIRPLKSTAPRRGLVTVEQIDNLCAKALETSKNGPQLVDYLRLLQYSGAREKEALRLRWADVDLDRKQLVVGADGLAKNHEARTVDFNPSLESHLRDMHARRAPDCQWLFPSPQRGEADKPSKTLRESMKLARVAAGMKEFGFHDLRHHFISMAVMSGVDFMTISRWVGHKDGGVLIGKVYGHIANEHRQKMAARVSFTPDDGKVITLNQTAAA
jgi:integrase